MMEANNQDEGSPGRTTQMLMQMMSQMSEQLQNVQASQQALRAEREADREEMRTQIRHMQSAIATPVATPQPPPPISAIRPEPRRSISPETAQAKKKPTIPDPKLFDGNRRNFRAWQLAMESKLRVDGPALGGLADRFAYIYARLDQTPQGMAAAFFEKGGADGSHDPSQFMEYLASCYGDPNIKQRALSRLETMRQGDRETFAAFLPKFERELADSGGASWEDPVRINALKRVINQELRSHLVGQLNLPTTYPGYVNALQSLGANLDEHHFHSRKQTNGQRQQRNPSPARRQAQPERAAERQNPDRMDWEPIKVGKHASRGGQERKSEGHRPKGERRCYRCDEVGHVAAYCTQGPRERSAGKSERQAGKPERPQQRTKTARIEPRRKDKQEQDDEAGSQYETASDDASEN